MKLSALLVAASLSLAVNFWALQPLASLPEAWIKAGPGVNAYELGVDHLEQRSGRGSKTIRSLNGVIEQDFATVMQNLRADQYRGSQVRFSAEIKSSELVGWGGLWMQVEASGGKILALDNMQARPIKQDSEWQRHEVILNIAPEATLIRFGLHMTGVGQIWMDNLVFEKVLNQSSTNTGVSPDDFVSERTEPVL